MCGLRCGTSRADPRHRRTRASCGEPGKRCGSAGHWRGRYAVFSGLRDVPTVIERDRRASLGGTAALAAADPEEAHAAPVEQNAEAGAVPRARPELIDARRQRDVGERAADGARAVDLLRDGAVG